MDSSWKVLTCVMRGHMIKYGWSNNFQLITNVVMSKYPSYYRGT
jgi:hypothetical protein